MNGMGARPARFRRERVLVVGCGDVGLRVLALAQPAVRLLALSSSPERRGLLRRAGAVPLAGDLDEPHTLARLAALGTRVLHLAPPPSDADDGFDPRTHHLLRALARRSLPRVLVYGSTTGVYGDCQGQWVQEVRAPRPQTLRARRRWDAERAIRRWSRQMGVASVVLRIAGIYGADRPGGTPVERLQRGAPVLRAEEDVFTNHIHADDLARACWLALWRGGRWRCINASDDSSLKMGDYMDLAADLLGLPRPPRVSRGEAERMLPPVAWSFMQESRRLDNTRLKAELGLRLRYPTPAQGLLAAGTLAGRMSAGTAPDRGGCSQRLAP